MGFPEEPVEEIYLNFRVCRPFFKLWMGILATMPMFSFSFCHELYQSTSVTMESSIPTSIIFYVEDVGISFVFHMFWCWGKMSVSGMFCLKKSSLLFFLLCGP